MSSDMRQSHEYHELLRSGGCIVEELCDHEAAFVVRLRRLPLIHWIYIQRPENQEILDYTKKLGRKYKAIFIKVAPNAVVNTSLAAQWEDKLNHYGYKWDRLAITPTKTIMIDLNLNEDQLLKQMKSKTRYNIHLAERKGLTTRIISGDLLSEGGVEFDQCYKIIAQNTERHHAKPPYPGFFKRLFRAFGANSFVIFADLPTGEVGAVAVFIHTGEIISYQMNGSTENGRNKFAPTLVIWAGLLEGKRRECRWFDFDGIYDERYPDEEWKGFTRFKEGFGGRVITYMGCYIKRLPFI